MGYRILLPVVGAILLSASVPGWCATEADLRKKAAKEGVVRVFTNELAYGKILVEEFSKRFPVKVEHRSRGHESPSSVTFDAFEHEDPAQRADVVLRCQGPNLAEWVERGWTASLEDLPNWKRVKRPLDDSNRYAYFLGAPHIIAYSKKYVSQAEIPRSYAELTGPKWKDKVVLRDPLQGNSGAFLAEYIRHSQGDLSWYSRLEANGASVVPPAQVLKLVLSGERPVGLTRDVEYLLLDEKSRERIGWRFVDGELPYQFQLGVVSATAPHPAAARLFMNWVRSEDAEKVLVQRGYSIGSRQREHLARGKAWFMNIRAALPRHDSRIHEASRRLRSSGGSVDGRLALNLDCP